MAISRYDERDTVINGAASYRSSSIFKNRGVKKIKQYLTPNLAFPSPEELQGIKKNTVAWGVGTKYYNLAHEYYGDPQYWWVIAWFNLRPLESSYKPGDVVIVPTLETVLSAMELL